MIGISHKSRLARAHAIAANADAIAVLLTRLSAFELILENETCVIHRVVLFTGADICHARLFHARSRRHTLISAVSALVDVDTCVRCIEYHARRAATNTLIGLVHRALTTNANETRRVALGAALTHASTEQHIAATTRTRACTAR